MGWIDGMACETLPMSVEPAKRDISATRLDERPSERLGVAAVERGERGVVPHLRVRRGRAVDAQRASGRQRARLEAAQHLLANVRRGRRACARARSTVAVVCAGTMFGASPPRVTMPCTRSVGRMCWRSRPMAVCATTSASAALTPSSGRGGGVRRLAVVVRLELGEGEGGRLRACRTARDAPSSPRARRRTRRARAAGSCRRRSPRPACRRR